MTGEELLEPLLSTRIVVEIEIYSHLRTVSRVFMSKACMILQGMSLARGAYLYLNSRFIEVSLKRTQKAQVSDQLDLKFKMVNPHPS